MTELTPEQRAALVKALENDGAFSEPCALVDGMHYADRLGARYLTSFGRLLAQEIKRSDTMRLETLEMVADNLTVFNLGELGSMYARNIVYELRDKHHD